MEDGTLDLWNAAALMDGKGQQALAVHKQAHAASVRSLDFNPFQHNLLATGSSSAEIFIWDLNNTAMDKPYSPGQRSQKLDDILCLQWNKQIPHILASGSNNGAAVIWDLKTRREIINLTSPTRKPISAIAWNPDISTQVLTASDDDDQPVIYVWDLRNAHAPEKILQGHSKGVLSLSWSAKDSGLLLSAGKDNRTLLWNPNTAQVLGEFQESGNWVFDVNWCPKHPDLLSTSSFDGMVKVYSILGDTSAPSADPLHSLTVNSVNDPFAAPKSPSASGHASFSLSQPPKWLRRSCGATFGFGNRLVAFGQSSVKKDGNVINVSAINIHQVQCDKDLALRSTNLEKAVANNEFQSFCLDKVKAANSQKTPDAAQEKMTWELLDRLMDKNSREKIVEALGFKKEDLAGSLEKLKLSTQSGVKKTAPKSSVVSPRTEVATSIVNEAIDSSMDVAQTNESNEALFGGVSNSSAENSDLEFLEMVNETPFQPHPSAPQQSSTKASAGKFTLYKGSNVEDAENLITRCVVIGDYAGAVAICLYNNRLDDALMLAVCGGTDLLESTRKAFLERKKSQHTYLRIIAAVANQDLQDIVDCVDVGQSWREVLALLCTYATPEEFPKLADILADRLYAIIPKTSDAVVQESLLYGSIFSYMCAANFDKVVAIWIDLQQKCLAPFVQKIDKAHISLFSTREFAGSLQGLLEKVTVYSNAIGYTSAVEDGDETKEPSAALTNLFRKYAVYAGLLVNQGHLSSALQYLNSANGYKLPILSERRNSEVSADMVDVMKHKIYNALGSADLEEFKNAVPSVPFEQVSVHGLAVEEPAPMVPEKTANVGRSSEPAYQNGYTAQQSAPYPANQNGMYNQQAGQYGSQTQLPAYAVQQPPAAYGSQPNAAPYGVQSPPAAYGVQAQQTMAYGSQQLQQVPPYGNTQQASSPYAQPQTAAYGQSPYGQPQSSAYGVQHSQTAGYGFQPAAPNQSYGMQAPLQQQQPPPPMSSFQAPRPPPIFSSNSVQDNPTSPIVPPPSQAPLSKMGGFNDPPADVFKTPKPTPKAAPITAPIRPQMPQPAYGAHQAQNAPAYGAPMQQQQSSYQPQMAQQGQPPVGYGAPQQQQQQQPPQAQMSGQYQAKSPVAPVAAPEPARFRTFKSEF